MWSETVGLKTRPVSETKEIGLGLGLANKPVSVSVSVSGLGIGTQHEERTAIKLDVRKILQGQSRPLKKKISHRH